jgi:release factor glutamine methyltransferase
VARNDDLYFAAAKRARARRVSAGVVAPTVEIIRRGLATRLRAAGIDSPELDARILASAVLGLDLTGLIASAHRIVTPGEAQRLSDFASRRLAGEPVARILGAQEFWGLSIQLSTATLVPRSDSEVVVEFALEQLGAATEPDRRLRIADLGTGSGAIVLALLSEQPRAYGIGTDINDLALRTARTNAVRLALGGRIGFVACDYAAALSGPFDLIVSNPPYIRSAEIAGLAPEVRKHDPRLALDGGTDGLDAYRSLIPQAAHLLSDKGILVVEIGQGQSVDVEGLMTASGLTLCGQPKRDLAGIPRAVAGIKSPR